MGWKFGKKRQQFPLKRIIVIATEGTVTEPEYFQKLNSMSETTAFLIVENLGNGSDPCAVLARMKKHLKRCPLGKNDEAWIVVDQDKWSDDSFKAIKEWANMPNYHYAISIQRFEDWLKLHGGGDKTWEKDNRLLLCGKDKHIPPKDVVKKDRVFYAMEKAKKLYSTSGSVGNVFELIESFFSK